VSALTLVLVVLLVVAGRVVTLYLWPYAPCRKCEGSGRNRGSKRARFGQCRRCEGAGRRQRFGARTVHRGRVALAERRKARK
jgi:DnaJ-class molecular chaperone